MRDRDRHESWYGDTSDTQINTQIPAHLHYSVHHVEHHTAVCSCLCGLRYRTSRSDTYEDRQ